MQTLGELLKYLQIKQIDVKRTLKQKYGVSICEGYFRKEGHWFSKKASLIQDVIEKEYGIYYDGAVWKGGINYGN